MVGSASKETTDERREVMLRWLFWTLFFLGVMGAFGWKVLFAGTLP
jgi:hypothetical protein